LGFSQSIVVPEMASLAQDTVVRKELISSLTGFLAEKDSPIKSNEYVLNGTLPETSALLDEMKAVEQSNRFNDKNFYKCHLTNFVKLEGNNYLIQFSYIGIDNTGTPLLRASFRLMGRNVDGKFYFYSPLKQNTLSWKSRRSMNIVFHYKDTLVRKDAEAYLKTVTYYDKKLGIGYSPVDYYYCDNFPEAQQLLGLDYKSDYNGIKADILSGRAINMSVVLSGYNFYNQRFDPHDLWHDRLRIVLNSDTINRPVDEGCAYLYGGSWGFTWHEVLYRFKQFAADHPDADWLSLYTGTKNYVDGDKGLKVPYVLNALIVRKIEKEKGFAPVMQLLSCGKRQSGDENYFRALEKITGITKASFNAEMWKLIKDRNI
ncbi:MAG: hypothetical protein ACXVIY_01845, partial [Mucilaginibacter sp.]